jgi:DNA-binding beta-propeller fold protein YncE
MRVGTASRTLVALAFAALAAAACSSSTTKATTPSRHAPGNAGGGPSPFTIEARHTAKSLGLQDPANLAIGPDGNLYVTDALQRVNVLSPDGKVLRRWGSAGNGPGQFHFVPHDAGARGVSASIAVGSDGRVYVIDSGNARIEVFTASGRFVRSFGGFGNGTGQFLSPQFLTADGAGNVYVADDVRQTLTKYSATGAVQWQVGDNAGDTELAGHFHVSGSSIDAHGRIVLANDDRSRVVYLDARGNKVDHFGSAGEFPQGSCDVSIDPAGYVFVNSCAEPLDSPHYTQVFDRSHHLVGAWSPSPLGWAPRFGAHGAIFTLADDGSILRLRLNVSEG